MMLSPLEAQFASHDDHLDIFQHGVQREDGASTSRENTDARALLYPVSGRLASPAVVVPSSCRPDAGGQVRGGGYCHRRSESADRERRACVDAKGGAAAAGAIGF